MSERSKDRSGERAEAAQVYAEVAKGFKGRMRVGESGPPQSEQEKATEGWSVGLWLGRLCQLAGSAGS